MARAGSVANKRFVNIMRIGIYEWFPAEPVRKLKPRLRRPVQRLQDKAGKSGVIGRKTDGDDDSFERS